MGRTSKPLTILVADELVNSEPVQELIAKGHDITTFSHLCGQWDSDSIDPLDPNTCDLIIGPQCQLMTVEHLPYLDEAVKRVRKAKYPGKKGEQGVDG